MERDGRPRVLQLDRRSRSAAAATTAGTEGRRQLPQNDDDDDNWDDMSVRTGSAGRGRHFLSARRTQSPQVIVSCFPCVSS